MFQEGKINQITCETSANKCVEIDPDLHAFWIHRWNLRIIDGVIMNGTRIIILKSLQNEYLRCLHIGHFGISKCRAKARAKSTVYWPGIDKDITNLIACCDTCRQVQHSPPTFDEHSVEACYPSHIFGSDIANTEGNHMSSL